MKKKRFSLNKALFISSLLILGFTVIMFALLGNFIFGKFQSQLIQQYKENSELAINSYRANISFFLQTHYEKLDYLEEKGEFKKLTKDKILERFLSMKKNIVQIYEEIFYINPNGEVYNFSGVKSSVDKGKHIKNSEKYSDLYFVTDPFEFKGKTLFAIGKALKNSFGEYNGVLGVALKLSDLGEFIKKAESYGSYRLGIIDSGGRFVYHSEDADLMLKKFIPENKKFKNLSSEYVVSLKSGFLQTESSHGELIDIIFRPIEGTKWVIELGIPHSKITQINFLKESAYWFFLITIIFFVGILLCVENAVFSYFQKKKMIKNNYDNLTNLWTRQKFESECTVLLKHNKKSKFLLINADIRGFKLLNQNYGGQVADKLLYYFSELLNIYAKKFKGILARGYADRFYLFFKISDMTSSIEMLKKDLDELNKTVKDYEIPFVPKFGIALYSESNQNDTIQDLIGKASFARGTIKDNALSQYSIYDSSLLKTVNEEQYLEQHMESALKNGEFFVVYQPKIDLKTEKIVGAEALVRWNEPKLGLLPPIKFIPLFERNGFVKKLDFYVYEKVFQFVQKQLQNNGPIVPISVNMSRIHIQPRKFIDEFMQIFKKYKVNPDLIEVEILERSIMEDNALLEITNLLHDEGFKVAMDDFGVGESSLNMLTKIPVDVLKFDRGFLLSSTNENGEIDKKNSVFIQTLIDLSKNLEKLTIFEGVETETQKNFLKSMNCDQVQGYYYSKPLEESDFLKFMNKHI